MQTPIKITQRLSPNRTIGRDRQIPDIICVHTTGNTFTSGVNTALNPSSGVSYHYIIAGRDDAARQVRDGDIVQTVDLANMAWANGTNNSDTSLGNRFSTIQAVREREINANLYSVSIGLGDMPNGIPSARQMDALVWLIQYIHSEVKRLFDFDIPLARTNVVGHNEIVPRHRPNCPGRNFPWGELMERLNAMPESSVPNVVLSDATISHNGQPLVLRNLEGKPLDIYFIDGTLYAPVSPLARAFGHDARWDGASNRLTITSKNDKILP